MLSGRLIGVNTVPGGGNGSEQYGWGIVENGDYDLVRLFQWIEYVYSLLRRESIDLGQPHSNPLFLRVQLLLLG